ncbi:unnamed protein product [Ilex paraguariensis]|uniref:Uncharacterized protein n=1 Tax=Ilex paraguariensis TaxID=185542 RepID=A0ABC8RKZ8_9AQUA
MASSSSSLKPLHLPWHFLYVLFLLFLLINSCFAMRTGRMMMGEGISKGSLEHMKHSRLIQESGYRYRSLVFQKLPKGVYVPPSGPSNRHNSVVNSSPQN